jgi:sphinganine-1-phosphate aldolase
MKNLIDSNTIALVASTPSYGSGAFDPVEEIAKLAHKNKIGCHVDACLGGFVIAF